MKKLILAMMLFLTVGLSKAQVGINTQSPLGILHIDPKGDTQKTGVVYSSDSDDVIVTSDGNMGIGTANPQRKLDVRGSLRIADGTEQDGYLFTALDNTGLGEWRVNSMSSKIGTWELKNSESFVTTTTAITKFIAASVMGTNEIGLATTGANNLTIPKGKYLMLVNQDIGGAEYGIFYMMDASSNTPIYTKYYGEWLVGSLFILEIPQPTTCLHSLSGAGYCIALYCGRG